MSHRRPNLLHVFADQMRAMELSCAGSPNIETPNMDRLAREGACFTQMYTPSPLCCPARASMMTGRLPHRAGVWRNNQRLREDVPCIAEITLEAGYATGHIGKWHLDGTRCPEDGYHEVPRERHRGFDYWAGFEHGHRYWTGHYFCGDATEHRFPDGTYEPDGQTDLALEFLRENRGRPWHLDLSWGPPHFPFDQEKPEDRDWFASRPLQLRPNVPDEFREVAEAAYRSYLAMVRNLDWNLRRLLATLDELSLADDTIVVFTSDHGDMLYSHGQRYKRRPQEESARVPFLIRYPGAIAPGQFVPGAASLVDEVPTLLDLMGIPRPAMDGWSHAAALTGSPSAGEPPKTVYLQAHRLGCRDSDPGPNSHEPWRAVCDGRHKAVFTCDTGSCRLSQLFDLEQDPDELSNLAEAPECDELRARFTDSLRDWVEGTEDEQFPLP